MATFVKGVHCIKKMPSNLEYFTKIKYIKYKTICCSQKESRARIERVKFTFMQEMKSYAQRNSQYKPSTSDNKLMLVIQTQSQGESKRYNTKSLPLNALRGGRTFILYESKIIAKYD